VRTLIREAFGIAVCAAIFLGAGAFERRFPLPLPAGVLGALFLTALLASSRRVLLAAVAPGADRLLRHLGLLFVPAAVLALRQRALLVPALLPLALVVVVSSVVGLVVAGVVTEKLSRRDTTPPEGDTAAAREEEPGT
jgi:holin-like protein